MRNATQIARADEGFVGTGRQVAAGQRETGQGQAQAHHAGAHADARGQFEFLVIQPVRPGIDLFEEGDEFFGRVLDRVDVPGRDIRATAEQRESFRRFAHAGDPLADAVVAMFARLPVGQGRRMFETAIEEGRKRANTLNGNSRSCGGLGSFCQFEAIFDPIRVSSPR